MLEVPRLVLLLMAPHRKPKSSYTCSPGKGTKSRAALLAMLRETGLTGQEAVQRGFVVSASSLGTMVSKFRDMQGFDIVGVPTEINRKAMAHLNARKSVLAYRVVGKYRWDGTYRSFVERSIRN